MWSRDHALVPRLATSHRAHPWIPPQGTLFYRWQADRTRVRVTGCAPVIFYTRVKEIGACDGPGCLRLARTRDATLPSAQAHRTFITLVLKKQQRIQCDHRVARHNTPDGMAGLDGWGRGVGETVAFGLRKLAHLPNGRSNTMGRHCDWWAGCGCVARGRLWNIMARAGTASHWI